jgi:hypothetical protein
MKRNVKVKLLLILLMLPGLYFARNRRQGDDAPSGFLTVVGPLLGWPPQENRWPVQPDLESEAISNHQDEWDSNPRADVLVAKRESEPTRSINANESAIAWQSNRPPFLQMDTTVGTLFGIPVAQFSDESWLMRNDGAIQRISRDQILHEKITAVPFEPISHQQLVLELRKEFGPGFQVRAEKPYVFVTQSKNASQWAGRFRNLNLSLKQYARKYGLECSSLDFPLIAIVLGSESEFLQYARAQQADLPPNCGGFYSQRDNRIVLFEDANKVSRQEVQDTICHEAIHQLAFNMGLHKRCAGTPLWLAEGFATIFEAPAYSAPNSDGRSRWPASRRETWLMLLDNDAHVHRLVDSLVRNDNAFKQEPELAYAVAWGLAHYLSTNSPREFADYLHQIGQLPSLVEFSAEDRWAHFRRTFKIETSQLVRQLKSHLRAL